MALGEKRDGIGSVREDLEYPLRIKIAIVQMTEKMEEGPEFLKGDPILLQQEGRTKLLYLPAHPVYEELVPLIGRQAILEKPADAQEIGY